MNILFTVHPIREWSHPGLLTDFISLEGRMESTSAGTAQAVNQVLWFPSLSLDHPE